jgi:hypothetical protein
MAKRSLLRAAQNHPASVGNRQITFDLIRAAYSTTKFTLRICVNAPSDWLACIFSV